ncbi:MAG: hypothetical protein MZW92_16360 [Comamonadaceae bacterium]|nr:hypothetical protein [Comamonadaceae bacterium]
MRAAIDATPPAFPALAREVRWGRGRVHPATCRARTASAAAAGRRRRRPPRRWRGWCDGAQQRSRDPVALPGAVGPARSSCSRKRVARGVRGAHQHQLAGLHRQPARPSAATATSASGCWRWGWRSTSTSPTPTVAACQLMPRADAASDGADLRAARQDAWSSIRRSAYIGTYNLDPALREPQHRSGRRSFTTNDWRGRLRSHRSKPTCSRETAGTPPATIPTGTPPLAKRGQVRLWQLAPIKPLL